MTPCPPSPQGTPLPKGWLQGMWESREPSLTSPVDPTVYNWKLRRRRLLPRQLSGGSGQIRSLQLPGWQTRNLASSALLAPGSTSGGAGAAPPDARAGSRLPSQGRLSLCPASTWATWTPQIPCLAFTCPCSWVASDFQERPDSLHHRSLLIGSFSPSSLP